MLIVLSVAITSGMLVLSVILGRKGRPSRMKDIPYECGMIPIGQSNARLSVKFYLVAMLFILFDIEVVFLYPWAVVYKDMLADPETRHGIFVSMMVFQVILAVGFIYEFKKRAFDWKE